MQSQNCIPVLTQLVIFAPLGNFKICFIHLNVILFVYISLLLQKRNMVGQMARLPGCLMISDGLTLSQLRCENGGCNLEKSFLNVTVKLLYYVDPASCCVAPDRSVS